MYVNLYVRVDRLFVYSNVLDFIYVAFVATGPHTPNRHVQTLRQLCRSSSLLFFLKKKNELIVVVTCYSALFIAFNTIFQIKVNFLPARKSYEKQ